MRIARNEKVETADKKVSTLMKSFPLPTAGLKTYIKQQVRQQRNSTCLNTDPMNKLRYIKFDTIRHGGSKRDYASSTPN